LITFPTGSVDLPRQRAEVGDLTRDINVALVVESVLTREHWWPSETDSSPFAASRSLLLDESVRIVRYSDCEFKKDRANLDGDSRD